MIKEGWKVVWFGSLILVTGLALLGLLGYLPGLRRLASVHPDYIPMAPSTAVCFLSLAISLAGSNRKTWHPGAPVYRALALLVALFGLLELLDYFTVANLDLEATLVPTFIELHGDPVRRMSPSTGLGFFAAGLAAFFVPGLQDRIQHASAMDYFTGALNLGVFGLGFVFSLAYFYQTPLLYDVPATIPMALTTALGFLLLAVALMAVRPEAFPLRSLTEDSTRGHLLRAILPLAVFAAVLGLIARFSPLHTLNLNPAVLSAAITILAVLAAVMVSTWVSRKLGAQIDRQRALIVDTKEALRITLNSIGDAVIATDLAGRVTQMNPVAESLTGWSKQEATGQPLETVFQIRNEQTRHEVESPVTRVLKNGHIVGLANHTLLIARDGKEFPIADSGAPIRNDAGEIVGVVLVFRDRTQERAARKALEESEERFRRAISEAPFPAMIHAEDGEVITINAEWTRLTGYRQDELPTIEAWTEKAYGERRGPEREVIDQLYEASGHTDEGDFEIRCRDDSRRTWTFCSTPLGTDAAGRRLVMSMALDFTARKQVEAEKEKLQSQLFQAQKLESVGRLAGGVAHDFNNMLGVILGYTDMALEQTDPGQPLFDDLQEIHKAAERSAELTRQLLAFARKQIIVPMVIDLNETVEGTIKMLRQLIGEDVDLAWLPGESPVLVKVDPAHIDQILANLCINARDAIADVGKVTIETDAVSFDEAYCADHAGFAPGEYVLLAVSDNGHGMSPETVSQVFEPFFTTKEPGKGTGLGLASVYGAVRQNGGFINVYSEPGQGTTFKIYLPRHEAGTPLQADKATATPTASGSETILLVEDESAVLHMATSMLERLGYVVISADTPGKAIREAHECSGAIDLLMTDVVMPEMNGRDLARNLLSVYPDIKCLFMSGYTADVIAHQSVLDEGVFFIQKPFSFEDLEAKLREVLDNKDAD